MAYALIATFLLVSGASSLIYEIIWARLLSLNIGSDNLSISIVLSCFFLGISLGSYLSARIKNSPKALFNAYILLEAAIAISALVLFPVFANLDSIIQSFPVFSTSVSGKIIITFVLLLIPTVAIGATFPIAVRLTIQSNKTLGLRIGQLYFYNTFGAVLGSIATGFLLVPSFGLDGTNYFAIVLNLLVIGIAWFFRSLFYVTHQNEAMMSDTPLSAENEPTPSELKTNKIALISLALSGFILLACEVAWSKYFTILTGASLASFSTILAFTLLGIAIGSWVIRKRIALIKTPITFLAFSYLLIAFLMMLQRESFTFLPDLMNRIEALDSNLDIKQFFRYGLLALFILPITFMFGVVFPLSISLYSQNHQRLERKLAVGYSTNTLAGVVGALVTGFWLLPTFGTDTLIVIIIFILLGLPVFLIYRLYSGLGSIKKIALASFPPLIIGLSLVADGLQYDSLISAVKYRYENGKPIIKAEYLYLKEGKNSVISVVKSSKNYAILQNNGLSESMIALNDYSTPIIFETLQAYFPYLLHPDAQSAFLVGYGGGVTTQAFTDTEVSSIDVVEIDEVIIDAVKAIPKGPIVALQDPRVNLVISDARTTLLSTNKKYDIITSQPSHPWVAGSSNLFSKKFFEITKSKLNEDGIYSQWLALFAMDENTLKSVLRTFYLVYPYGFVMINNFSDDLMLIGSKSPVVLDIERMKKKMRSPRLNKYLAKFSISQPSDFFYFFALSREEILSSTLGSPISTDFNLLLELGSLASFHKKEDTTTVYNYLNTTRTLDILPYLVSNNNSSELYELGVRFLQWNKLEKSQLIVEQLDSINSQQASILKYQVQFWLLNYEQASAIYLSKTNWPDIIRTYQFEIYIHNKAWNQAIALINSIKSNKLKMQYYAMYLYKSNRWEELTHRTSISNEEELWVLMAKVRNGDFHLLRKLNSLIQYNYQYLPQIEVLADIYRRLNAPNVAKWYRFKMNEIIRNRLVFNQILIKKAQQKNNQNWVNNIEKHSAELIKVAENFTHK